MSFDESLRRLEQRLTDYQQSGRIELVVGESALADGAELWHAMWPVGPERPTPEDLSRLGAAHSALGYLFFFRYIARPVPQVRDLAQAIEFLVPLTNTPAAVPQPLHKVIGPDADPAQQVALANTMLQPHLTGAAEPGLLNAGIALLELATAMPARDGFDLAVALSDLGGAYRLRFEKAGAAVDLQRAVDMGEQAVAAILDDHAHRVGSLLTLAGTYRTRYESNNTPADLDRAIALGEQAIAAAPANHLHREPAVTALRNLYDTRYNRTSRATDLDRTIELGEDALGAIASDEPGWPAYLSKLLAGYFERFDRSAESADLERAIDLGEQWMAVDPVPEISASLGAAYRWRFERMHTVSDLHRAIELGEQAVVTAAVDHPMRASASRDLAIAYGERYESAGGVQDLQRCIELGEQAVAADDPPEVVQLSNLGYAYRLRFKRFGAAADLDRAVELGEQAVAATPADDPGRARHLARLGVFYSDRFERTAELADLDRAIELEEQAVAIDHPDRLRTLSNLGDAHRLRFDRTGVLADLERAIVLIEQAVTAMAPDDPSRPGNLPPLSMSYMRRFERTHAPADLDRAIELAEQAMATMADDAPNRVGAPHLLTGCYLHRFKQSGAPADLECAIELAEHAVSTIADDDIRRPRALHNLSVAYLTRFEHTGAVTDLDHAIELDEQAVASTPADHPMLAQRLTKLCNDYLARFEATGQRVTSGTVRTLTRQVLSTTTAAPADRASAAAIMGWLAQAMGEHATARALFDSAVAIAPLIAPREGSWSDQEARLGRLPGLVSAAVAAHCAIDDAAGAVEATEFGRGVLLAAQLDSRTDLTDLDQAYPELAARFRSARDRLNNLRPDVDGVSAVDDLKVRKHLWAEHDDSLAQIRRVHPDFHRFLVPPRLADLRSAAAGGVVVVVNADEIGSDAIIVTSDGDPVRVPLPDLAASEVVAQTAELLTATHDGSLSARLRRTRVLPEILSWLWDAAVEPILDALPNATGTDADLPRVWWLPIRLLGLFPLHAAGHPGQPGALDRVVSSYTPTLRALAHVRSRRPVAAHRQLTVDLAHTSGLPDLPGTAAEAAALHARHPGAHRLTGHQATTARVLEAIPRATWVHFACHASADPTAPSRSGLHLHDGVLPLPDIGRTRLEHAELAYLSACSTAHTGWGLADEALHLASAFQLAGFRHVIASLWALDDTIAAATASAFYDRLPTSPMADSAATVLHDVTCDLRSQYPDRPDLWAALVHSGA